MAFGARKFFRCTICNYGTPVKARFTKHVKYHSMPLIKCDFCDFKTPYKWNLDRHLKNHCGEGSLSCPLCNFKCDIKQSLTVHVQNHHSTLPDNIGELIKQSLGYGEASTAEMDSSYLFDAGESLPASTNIGLSTLKRRNSSSPVGKRKSLLKLGMNVSATLKRLKTDSVKPELSSKEGKVFTTNKFKCQYCNFRAPRIGDLNRHVIRCHQFRRKSPPNLRSSSPKPLPCLIPIASQKAKQSSSQKQLNSNKKPTEHAELQLDGNQHSSSTVEKDQEIEERVDQNTSDSFEEKSAFLQHLALTPVREPVPVGSGKNEDSGIDLKLKHPTPQLDSCGINGSVPRRRTSFFEKLTQKLVANSKLDEGSHQGLTLKSKSITITSNSNRCQYCRHRCKTSVDLISHLGKCPEARRCLEDQKVEEEDNMTRKVFVWNGSPNQYEPEHNEVNKIMCEDDDLVGYETSAGMGSVDNFDSLTSPETEQGNSVTTSRKVYKCPQQNCGFWATTASRFHVHIVGHFNLKPFECSQCSYRSNWRWDITKHIRLKSLRDSAHMKAKILLTHESGQRNYRKYDRYLVGMDLKYSADSKLPDCSTVASKRGDVELNPPSIVQSPISSPTASRLQSTTSPKLKMPKLTKAPVSRPLILERLMTDEDQSTQLGPPPILRPMLVSPSNTIRTFVEAKMHAGGEISLGSRGTDISGAPVKKHTSLKVEFSPPNDTQKSGRKGVNTPKKQTWKCKRCLFKHPNKELVLIHISQRHKPRKGEAVSILNQNNLMAVGEDGTERDEYQSQNNENNKTVDKMEVCQYAYDTSEGLFKCKFCPFFTTTLNAIEEHLENHSGKPTSNFSCAYCSSIMSSRRELLQHMKVHGSEHIIDDNTSGNFDGLISPEETPPKPRGSSSNGGPSYKKYHCMECPYVTDSKGQFLYHKQFHTPRDAPFKCNSCSYNVSHKHLLHQHIRVHGPHITKHDTVEDIPESGDNMQYQNEEEQHANSRPTVLVLIGGRPLRMFRCQFCPKGFETLTDVYEHEEDHNQESSSPSLEAINLSIKSIPRNVFKKPEAMPNRSSQLKAPSQLDFVTPALPKSVLYLCEECPARFFYEKELKIHHTFHVNASNFKCRLCSYSARQQTPHLLSHMKVHGEEYQIKTKMLLSKYPKAAPIDFDSSELAPFISITPTLSGVSGFSPPAKGDSSKPDASIQCTVCPAKFNTLASFQHHIKNHGRLTLYTCRHCNFGADTLNNMTLHEILHAGADITIEPEPMLPFHNQHSSAISPVSVRTEAEPKVEGLSDELGEGAFLGNPEFIYPTYIKNGRVKSKRYKCSKCPSAFEKRDQFKVHSALHGCGQRYKCTVCDYSVTYYANFIQHLKKHSNQPNVPPELLIVQPLSKLRNEAASKLAKVSSTPSNPNGQTLKRPIKCGRCPYTTYNSKSFEEHLSHHVTGKEKTDLLTEKCPFCNFMVSKQSLLRDHIRLHFPANKKNMSADTHMFIEDVEISVKKGDKKEQLYCEKENYNDKYGSKEDQKVSESITIIDMKHGLPVSLLNRKGVDESQPE